MAASAPSFLLPIIPSVKHRTENSVLAHVYIGGGPCVSCSCSASSTSSHHTPPHLFSREHQGFTKVFQTSTQCASHPTRQTGDGTQIPRLPQAYACTYAQEARNDMRIAPCRLPLPHVPSSMHLHICAAAAALFFFCLLRLTKPIAVHCARNFVCSLHRKTKEGGSCRREAGGHLARSLSSSSPHIVVCACAFI